MDGVSTRARVVPNTTDGALCLCLPEHAFDLIIIRMAPAPSGKHADEQSVEQALHATRESRRIEFKREFSAVTPGAWCELLKDVAAIANSGGGIIVIGLENDGSISGWDPADFLRTDLADVTNTFAKYVGEQFDDFEIRSAKKGQRVLAVVIVRSRVGSPVVFEKPGTYSDGESHQKTAFSRGTVYFRHGAKSEPGNARDLSRFVTREVDRQRRAWLSNIRKVAAAPKGSQVVVVSSKNSDTPLTLREVRVVDDPSAPTVARTNYDITHPYRQSDLIRAVNERLGRRAVNQFDIKCIRKVHGIDSNSGFFHKPRYSSPQYSDSFVDWLVTEIERQGAFLSQARAAHTAIRTTHTNP